MANDRAKSECAMDGFEPLILTVNAFPELTTVKTVKDCHNSMISKERSVNSDR